MVDFFINLGFSTILSGVKKIFDALVDFAVALKALVWDCKPLRNTIGMVIIVIAIAIGVNLALVARSSTCLVASFCCSNINQLCRQQTML